MNKLAYMRSDGVFRRFLKKLFKNIFNEPAFAESLITNIPGEARDGEHNNISSNTMTKLSHMEKLALVNTALTSGNIATSGVGAMDVATGAAGAASRWGPTALRGAATVGSRALAPVSAAVGGYQMGNTIGKMNVGGNTVHEHIANVGDKMLGNKTSLPSTLTKEQIAAASDPSIEYQKDTPAAGTTASHPSSLHPTTMPGNYFGGMNTAPTT